MDPAYDQQKQKISEDLDQTLSKIAGSEKKTATQREDSSEVTPPVVTNEPLGNEAAIVRATSESALNPATVANSKPHTEKSSILVAGATTDTKTVSSKTSAPPAKSIKGWMGVDEDLEVSSSSDEEEKAPPKSK